MKKIPVAAMLSLFPDEPLRLPCCPAVREWRKYMKALLMGISVKLVVNGV